MHPALRIASSSRVEFEVSGIARATRASKAGSPGLPVPGHCVCNFA